MLEEKVGSKHEITLYNGKEATLVVYNINPLVIGVEGLDFETNWKEQTKSIHEWYDTEFPEELKKVFTEDKLHNLSVEEIFDKIPDKVIPSSRNCFQLEYFKNKENRKYMRWYWLENKSSKSKANYACFVGGYDAKLWYGVCDDWNISLVRPAFHF